MKQYVKYALVGVAGYLIGFYEMKYKVIKAIAKGRIGKEEPKDNVEEGEAQQ